VNAPAILEPQPNPPGTCTRGKYKELQTAGTVARANPFVAVDPLPTSFFAWVVVWYALMLLLSIWSFRIREI
jgi:hypothetical protein